MTDGQLLERYICYREEAAFAAVVRRHGPMVWGVCLRILRSPADAEDAFQAVFLVLVRKAASIVPREKLVNWLYGVARQTALKARATASKRRMRERQVPAMPEPAARDNPGGDLRGVLDQELIRLPDKYRTALLLCDLEGRTRKEAAQQLGLPEGTVASRLAMARTLLAKRLGRLGIALPAGALTALTAEETVSAAVVSATIRTANLVMAGQAAAEVASLPVAALTEGVLKAMFLTKVKLAAAAVLAASMIGLGSTVIVYRTLASEPDGVTGTVTAKSPRAESETPKVPPGQPEAVAEKPKDEGKASTRTVSAPAGRSATHPRVRALQEERLVSLKKVVKRAERLHEQKAASADVVRQAKLRLYKAELDFYETPKERVDVLEKIVGVYKEEEDRIIQLQKSGAAAEDTVLEARIKRLEAEIELEREKAKLAAK